ncbi:DUF1572 domain-containing protein [Segetibacter sp. 3557_3]|uniref:DinB family protein n=1 Tax=Segetibacter sp. 3557_3 TaxID=2547429 RepID=UPI001058FCE7|nr:DinB family protein [Segetibacter sp. 3557_3]TDH29090.1 DUF1572 domain-containing protein [Segetibacter sp. 3557_3]
MLTEILQSLFTRDLDRLRTEIMSYKSEENLWKTDGNITNSAGNLCLHLLGNLNTYIGKEIGHTGYTRNREQEFSLQLVPREELIHGIDQVILTITAAITTIDESNLQANYPVMVFEQKTTTGYLLVHLATHLSYHLGQINYHRRMLDR